MGKRHKETFNQRDSINGKYNNTFIKLLLMGHREKTEL